MTPLELISSVTVIPDHNVKHICSKTSKNASIVTAILLRVNTTKNMLITHYNIYVSRTVEEGRERSSTENGQGKFPRKFPDLYVSQTLSQPPKRIQLRHKAPELAKLQAASSAGVRLTWPLELAHRIPARRKNRFFCCS